MNLSEASKKEIDVVLEKCGWRQTKQRVVLLKSIFDGKDKHFSINQMNETLKDKRSYFSLTTLYENLNTLSKWLSNKGLNKIDAQKYVTSLFFAMSFSLLCSLPAAPNKITETFDLNKSMTFIIFSKEYSLQLCFANGAIPTNFLEFKKL